MDISELVKITARAWSLSILGQLASGTPARQAPLLAATGASRTSFAHSMAHLIDLELLERNPGHGHPLRPEYRLTETGRQWAEIAHRIQSIGLGGEGDTLLRKAWSLPVLAVCAEPQYFGQIKRALPPITDRALSQTLKRLQGQHWLSRTTDTEMHPPRPIYRTDHTGLAIARAAKLPSMR
ncbi:MAG: winged helix-turn-helix transcriptional regulator [Pseudomonadota bacterium]